MELDKRTFWIWSKWVCSVTTGVDLSQIPLPKTLPRDSRISGGKSVQAPQKHGLNVLENTQCQGLLLSFISFHFSWLHFKFEKWWSKGEEEYHIHTPLTPLVWPLKVWIGIPCAISHTITVLSTLHDTTIVPSGENEHPFTCKSQQIKSDQIFKHKNNSNSIFRSFQNNQTTLSNQNMFVSWKRNGSNHSRATAARKFQNVAKSGLFGWGQKMFPEGNKTKWGLIWWKQQFQAPKQSTS